MPSNTAIDAYIAKQPKWKRDILQKLRRALHKADPDINEVIKWGAPTFEDHGIVAWMFCAAEWVHFSFPQGALLDSSHGLFEEGNDTASKAKRTIKLHRGQAVPTDVIIILVKEAAANNRAGKKVDFKVTKPGKQEFDLPKDYEDLLKHHGKYQEYKNRPFYQRRGWIGWIEDAKQPATREKRINMMLRELETGQYMPPKGQRK